MGKVKKSLVQKLLRSADHHLFELPKSWPVFTRYRTSELFLQHPAPPSVHTSDASMYKTLYKRYPEVKLQPVRLNSLQPSLAKRFVEKQKQAVRVLQAQWEQQRLQQLHHTPQQQLLGQQQQQQQQYRQQQQQDGAWPQQPVGDHQIHQVPDGEHVTGVKAEQPTPVMEGFKQVEMKLHEELKSAGRETTTGGYLEFIQQQEEEALQAAMKRLQEQQAAMS